MKRRAFLSGILEHPFRRSNGDRRPGSPGGNHPFRRDSRVTYHSRDPRAGRTRPAGSVFPRALQTRRRARCFPGPCTRNITWRARLKNGRVSVRRPGGGLGAFSTNATHRRFSDRAGNPGKSEAVWPSSPIPNKTTSGRRFRNHRRRRLSKRPASRRGSPGFKKKGYCRRPGTGPRGPRTRRAAPALLEGSRWGTQRSSPQNKWILPQGTDGNRRGLKKNRLKRSAERPPAKTRERGLRSVPRRRRRSATRSAAARAIAGGSANTRREGRVIARFATDGLGRPGDDRRRAAPNCRKRRPAVRPRSANFPERGSKGTTRGPPNPIG